MPNSHSMPVVLQVGTFHHIPRNLDLVHTASIPQLNIKNCELFSGGFSAGERTIPALRLPIAWGIRVNWPDPESLGAVLGTDLKHCAKNLC